MRFRSFVVAMSLVSSVFLLADSGGASGAPKLSTVKSLISTLFYGEAQAFQASSQAGWNYDYVHEYPGAFSRSPFMACGKKDNAYGLSDVPVLSTVMLVKGWIAPGPNGGGYIFAGKKPRGFTYIVTINESTPGNPQQQYQLHVTILNKKAYFYNGPSC